MMRWPKRDSLYLKSHRRCTIVTEKLLIALRYIYYRESPERDAGEPKNRSYWSTIMKQIPVDGLADTEMNNRGTKHGNTAHCVHTIS